MLGDSSLPISTISEHFIHFVSLMRRVTMDIGSMVLADVPPFEDRWLRHQRVVVCVDRE